MPTKRVIGGFACATVASSILGGLFRTFHISLFMDTLALPTHYFALGHSIFAVWNTANDVLGGWAADKVAARTGKRSVLLLWGGLLWCWCFLIPWLAPISRDSPAFVRFLHFLLSICLIDGCFSFVAIVKGSLLADLTIDHSTRTSISFVSNLCSILSSSLCIYFASQAWSGTDLRPFQAIAATASLLCALLFVVSAVCLPEIKSRNPEGSDISVRRFIAEFWTHHNFHAFLVMNVLLEAEVVFISQFLKTFVDTIASNTSPQIRSGILAVTPFLGRLAHLSLFPYVRAHGVYNVYAVTIVAKMIGASVCLTLWWSHPSIGLGFVVLFSVLVTGTISFFDLTISDIIDEHRYLNFSTNKASTSAMFWGTHALFAKPFNSLFPVIASKVLSRDVPHDETNESKFEDDLKWRCVGLVAGVALVTGVVQWFAWRRYTLRGARLQRVKQALESAEARHSSVDDDGDPLGRALVGIGGDGSDNHHRRSRVKYSALVNADADDDVDDDDNSDDCGTTFVDCGDEEL